jgi:transposase
VFPDRPTTVPAHGRRSAASRRRHALKGELTAPGVKISHNAIWLFLRREANLGRPPSSPDLNPIERAFATMKHRMRAAQKHATEDAWRHLGSLVASIEARECSNYFANTGYAFIKT